MTYAYARKMQRFIVYLIDFVLIMVIAEYIAAGVELLFGFDKSIMNTYWQSILTEYMAVYSGKGSVEVLNNYITKYASYFMVDLAFKLVFDFILILVALVIVPKYWGGKTLGRRAMNCKLVDKFGKDATLKNFVVRELLGTFFLYSFLGAFFGLVGVISFILVLATSRSLIDMISGTHMVLDNPILDRNVAVNKKPMENEVAPDYKEVEKEEPKQNKEEDSQDKYSVDEDDYKIE